MQFIRRYRAVALYCASFAMLLLVGLLTLHSVRAQEAQADVPRMPFDHLLFTTSSHCMSCHSQVHAPDGEDISIGIQWRASVMANSSRDPYWQASIRRETMDHPAATAAIEDKCATCHMPMQRYQARAEGLRGKVLQYLSQISSGAAMDEPEGELEDAADVKATLAADGVSCTVCHQIKDDNLGKPSSLDGGFLIDVTKKAEERVMFGPYDDPDEGRTRLMHSATGYTPKKVGYQGESALCASCHTLLTNALDDKGQAAGTLPEQMPFQEWEHSDYKDKKSCQSCHMTEVAGQAPITSVHAQAHDGVMRHIFVGGNAMLLRMLKDHHAELGVAATPAELEASAQRSERLLGQETASVNVAAARIAGGKLSFDVKVVNKTGHKLPTAYPARRVWLHVMVRDPAGKLVFESGAVRPDGSIAGNDNDADRLKFEPHYSRISRPDQVQIYESIMGDFAGRVTTGLLYGTHYLKDNRILPSGFDKATAEPRIAVVGDARQDPAFVAGSDTVGYDVDLPAATSHCAITVELLYEPIGFRWAHNLEGYDAPEPRRFLGYYSQHAPRAGSLLARAAATVG
jgi:hypothetical protein